MQLRLRVVHLTAALAVLIAGCSRQPPPQSNPAPPAPLTLSSSNTPPEFQKSAVTTPSGNLPREGGVNGYTGSDSCRTCHEDQHASWHRSFHRTMTQLPVPGAVQADFHNVTLTNDATRFTLLDSGGTYRIRMEPVAPPAPEAVRPDPLEVALGLVTGSHHMQVFWVGNGQGNTQVGFPFTWLIPEKRWVPRNTTFIRPPDMAHRPEVWNVICARCHATGPEPRPNAQERTLDTRAAELGIACEACHGPGERHVTARLAAKDQPKPDSSALAREIVHPAKLDPLRAGQVCGFCHSMKWIPNTERWTEHGFTFRPGDDLEQTTPVIRAHATNRPPALQEYLARNPELFEDFFWKDGMMRVSGREYNGMIESPCYQGQRLSCLSCHSSHESEPAGQMARNRTDHRACTQCHEKYRAPEAARAHSHHLPGSTGNDCYNCHMPHTTYGVLKGIRSHQITSPRIDIQLATGRPNACNLCHLDKTLSWTAQQLSNWFKQPIPELPAGAETLSDAVRFLLAGDAGQRALIAWGMAWEPARGTTGGTWTVPALAPLLDDPYAAIRCVAERSLRRLGAPIPAGYDYVISPADRPPAKDAVWRAWLASRPSAPPPPTTRMNGATVEELEGAIAPLLQSRDLRPMRLRE